MLLKLQYAIYLNFIGAPNVCYSPVMTLFANYNLYKKKKTCNETQYTMCNFFHLQLIRGETMWQKFCEKRKILFESTLTRVTTRISYVKLTNDKVLK